MSTDGGAVMVVGIRDSRVRTRVCVTAWRGAVTRGNALNEAAAQHAVTVIENQRLTGTQRFLRLPEFNEEDARCLLPHADRRRPARHTGT